MRSSRWKNQYIDLVAQTESIINFERDQPSQQESALVRSRIELAPNCICEIGSGSGQHLIELALQKPECLVIGIELRYKRAFRTAEKAAQRGIKNILVLRGDARYLADFIPADSLSSIYVNFPDPWSKRRWLKHRLLTPEFLVLLVNSLKPTGVFSYRTDHSEYFEATRQIVLKMQNLEVLRHIEDIYRNSPSSSLIPTEFEGLFRSRGDAVYLLEARKSPTAQ